MRLHYFRLIASLVICQLAGFIGSVFTTPAISGWYASLEKPTFNPPNWIFSPVWIFLYLLMGMTLYILWQNLPKTEAKIALWFFAFQLVLNIFWSVIFFGLKLPMVAFIEIIILWIFILLTMIKSSRVSKASVYLLLPYILWVNFAAILNFFLWRLNM
ncbi:MAG: tryptophan-rich sensory protein [Candidatus Aminicenantes bacterium]|nr:MAG: tryptophan-rich sensory protein [Candidatus Aminicenantes bacterium]